jgi:hypothetical protein
MSPLGAMPRLLTASKFARLMSNDGEDTQDGLVGILTNPSKTLANWYLGLGCLGLMLAVLNILGIVHPSYRVSWGGLLTFEYTNSAFGDKGTAAAFVAGDAVFMFACGLISYLGIRSLVGEDNFGDWFSSMLKNEWYIDLIELGNGGWGRLLGTWSIVASIVFYFSWGVMYMTWIDPGPYSIAIVLMSVGLVLRMLSSVEDDE